MLRIVYYHKVSDDNSLYSLSLNPKDFERQVRFLCRSFKPVSLSDVISYYCENKPLPNLSLLITFDDGYRDNLHFAYPFLYRLGIPAAVFVCSKGHDPSVPWWEQVRAAISDTRLDEIRWPTLQNICPLKSRTDKITAIQKIEAFIKDHAEEKDDRDMLLDTLYNSLSLKELPLQQSPLMNPSEWQKSEALNIEIGCHTSHHMILKNQLSEFTLQEEISNSKKEIENVLSHPIHALAYPSGVWSKKITECVHNAGYKMAFATKGGSFNSIFSIPRMGIDSFGKIESLLRLIILK